MDFKKTFFLKWYAKIAKNTLLALSQKNQKDV